MYMDMVGLGISVHDFQHGLTWFCIYMKSQTHLRGFCMVTHLLGHEWASDRLVWNIMDYHGFYMGMQWIDKG
jgi:hypothetical protein